MHRWCCKLLKVNSSNFDRYWVRIVVAFFSVMTSAVLRTEKCLDFFFNGKTQLVLKQWCWNINLSEITSDNNFYSETLDGFVWICRIFSRNLILLCNESIDNIFLGEYNFDAIWRNFMLMSQCSSLANFPPTLFSKIFCKFFVKSKL